LQKEQLLYLLHLVTPLLSMAYLSCNIVESIIDEVALEGLDGITLQGNLVSILISYIVYIIVEINQLLQQSVKILNNILHGLP